MGWRRDKTGGKKHKISIGLVNGGPSWCSKKNSIQHEFMHALGFHHEHQRPDRDKYIKVFENYIEETLRHNYWKADDMHTFGLPYDVLSIMHYPGDYRRPTASRYSALGDLDVGGILRCQRNIQLRLRKSRTLNPNKRILFYQPYKRNTEWEASDLDIKKIRCFYDCEDRGKCGNWVRPTVKPNWP